MKKKGKSKNLRKALLRKKYIALLLALFTFGVNIFAWFAFSTNAQLEIDGTVASWDVDFKDSNGVSSRRFVVDVPMKPGMDDFSKVFEVYNRSDVPAKFTYDVVGLKIFGSSINIDNITDKVNYLKTTYPFVIDIKSDKDTLDVGETAEFSVDVTWEFESATEKYYKVLDYYTYDSSFEYFSLNDNIYTPTPLANEIAYNNLKANLYLGKDDIDTYFGTQCGIYEKSTNLPCLVVDINLVVEQDS